MRIVPGHNIIVKIYIILKFYTPMSLVFRNIITDVSTIILIFYLRGLEL